MTCFSGHFLDYTLYLSSRLGLDAIISNKITNHQWQIDLTLSRMFKLWPNVKTPLPFFSTGHMIYIGTHAQEEIWLTMVPRSFID
ncbi:hypothetical protein J3R82DRAFT_11601 [Butyriboletus roseoflavus]|nr:hypothetical protein J3R82DRAFT_11601 [Butyriboletus roseoflavus]